MASPPGKTAAVQFLESLLDRSLRVLATDGRIFIGQLHCTDPVNPSRRPLLSIYTYHLCVLTCLAHRQDGNIILAHTYEHRILSTKHHARDTGEGAAPSSNGTGSSTSTSTSTSLAGTTARYIGLVIIPGEHVVSMELEEFASQSSTLRRSADFSCWSSRSGVEIR